MATRSVIVGDVRKLQTRTQVARKGLVALIAGQAGMGRSEVEVLGFIVERFDADGNALPPIAVELNCGVDGLSGPLNEGDRVALYDDGARTPAGVIAVPAIRNLTAGVTVGKRKVVERGRADVPDVQG